MTFSKRHPQPSRQRRRLLLAGLSGFVASVCGWSRDVLAAMRPRQAFVAEELDAALIVLFGDRLLEPSTAITVGVADLAENGAVVPVKVQATLAGVRAVTLLGSKNPVPLIARFEFPRGGDGFVATRVKLADSSDVIAVVETTDGIFTAKKFVEVTVGGCG